ncbi:MAG: class I SAM-dependent methyltransferase [Acidobacteriota bacterium]
MSILDFAGASQATVSFVTNYGHRLYSDDFVRSLDRVFGSAPAGASDAEFFENQSNPALVSDFFELALTFDDASFDGALVWDSLQFLSTPLLQTVVAKLHKMLRPGANLFALFHTDERIANIPTYAYRIQDHRTIQMVSRSQRRPAQIFNNRNLEKLFQDFESVKFFLTRDRLREVIVRR